MSKKRSKSQQGRPSWFILGGLVGLCLLIALLLRGRDIALFSPKGLIANDEHRLMVAAILIMLIIGIPTLSLLYFFAWRYREGGKKALVNHRSSNSKLFAFVFWAVPTIFVIILASLMLPATQKLEPQRSIESQNEPINIQVVALRWKWLFIYPKQNIATVNFIQIPTDTPVQFDLTADEAPMNSFWIPHLGGQLYAMTGHENRLNLMADTVGDYGGSAAEINGAGFAGMRFITRVTPKQDFDQWVGTTKQSTQELDASEYKKLLVPSQNQPTVLYGNADPKIYGAILAKYAGSHKHYAEAGY